MVPEAINFCVLSILAVAPQDVKFSPTPGAFPLAQIKNADHSDLHIQPRLVKKHGLEINRPVDFWNTAYASQSSSTDAEEQAKMDVLGLALELIAKFAEMYKDLPAFVEVFSPIFEIVYILETAKVPNVIKVSGCPI